MEQVSRKEGEENHRKVRSEMWGRKAPESGAGAETDIEVETGTVRWKETEEKREIGAVTGVEVRVEAEGKVEVETGAGTEVGVLGAGPEVEVGAVAGAKVGAEIEVGGSKGAGVGLETETGGAVVVAVEVVTGLAVVVAVQADRQKEERASRGRDRQLGWRQLLLGSRPRSRCSAGK